MVTMSNSLPAFLATDPDVYEHFMGRWSARLAEPFLEFAGVQSGDRVLDVGCGTGTISLALARRGAKTVGWMRRSRTSTARVVFDHILMSLTCTVTHATCNTPAPRLMPVSRLLPSMLSLRLIWLPPRCDGSHVQAGSRPAVSSISGVVFLCSTSCWIQARYLMRASEHYEHRSKPARLCGRTDRQTSGAGLGSSRWSKCRLCSASTTPVSRTTGPVSQPAQHGLPSI
jgi:hypothetical protein